MTQRPSLFDRLHEPIEIELKRVVGNRKSPLYQMLRYHFGWIDQMGMPERHSGQERRLGALCLAIAEAASPSPVRGEPIAGPERSRDRKSTRLNSSHIQKSRMPSSA